MIAYIKSLVNSRDKPLNNRTTPTMIRDNEVPNIQQEKKGQPSNTRREKTMSTVTISTPSHAASA